jgi:hypothetical protein
MSSLSTIPAAPVAASTQSPTTSNTTTDKPPAEKVKVHFVSVGSAPIMKKNKFQISGIENERRKKSIDASMNNSLNCVNPHN